MQTGGGGTGTDVSKEYVDQQISNVQGQVDTKVSKSGDTMTGSLNFNGNTVVNPVLESNIGIKVQSSSAGAAGKVTNLAAPSADSDAANKKYVDDGIKQVKQEISGELGGEYLALTGGDMTGDINMTGNSVVKFYDPIAARARARNLTDQMVKGSVYNDADAMVVKSETGPVALKGTDVSLSNGEGGEIAISGVTEIRRKKNDPNSGAVKLNDDLINLAADTVLVGQNGSMQGEISAGAINLYDGSGAAVLKRHNSHLDINVPDALGSVYINRNQTEGGTGEIHVTEVHAPNELRLNPRTTINMMSKRVVGMANGVNANDAVNVTQLGAVRTIAQNAQSTAESADAKADQALEKAESVGGVIFPCEVATFSAAFHITTKLISHKTGQPIDIQIDFLDINMSGSRILAVFNVNGIIQVAGRVEITATSILRLSNSSGHSFKLPMLTYYRTENDNQLFTNFPNKTAGTVEFTLGTSSDVGKQYNGMVISGQERTPLYMYAP